MNLIPMWYDDERLTLKQCGAAMSLRDGPSTLQHGRVSAPTGSRSSVLSLFKLRIQFLDDRVTNMKYFWAHPALNGHLLFLHLN
jgi:hypothetical protein